MDRIPKADIDAPAALLDTWRTGQPEAIGWAATLCDAIAQRFEDEPVSTDVSERTSALEVVALASEAMPKIKDESTRAKEEGDKARAAELEVIGARFEALARTLLCKRAGDVR